MVAALALGAAAPPLPAATLVVCAPGYPGSTAEAQPAMDAFAAAVGQAAGWPAGQLEAVYFETEQGGLDRLERDDAVLALVPLPFFLAHAERLKLEPRAQAVLAGGQAAEPWSLVAATGAVASAEGLAGYDLVSLAGYVPRFVRGPALGGWGEIPAGTRVTFSGAILSALRRAAAGAPVAVLLDGSQAASLPSLPFADKLTVVYRSPALPVSVLCRVGSRLPADRAVEVVEALTTLGATPAGTEALAGLRLQGFIPVDRPAIEAARLAFARAVE